LSYRPILDDFLRNIALYISRDIEIIFEPKNQGKFGRPDWRFYNANDFGVYGYVEAKALNIALNISIEDHKEQIDKYLTLQQKVILTDGLEFIFFYEDGRNERLSLIEKPIRRGNWGDFQINPRLEVKFRELFHDSGFRTCSETDLINEVAKRSKRLSEVIVDLSNAPLGSGLNEQENQIINALHQLKLILSQHHDPVLKSSKAFGDFVSQVLIFGLLYSHRFIIEPNDLPNDRYTKIQKFWTDALYLDKSQPLLPFRALIDALKDKLDPTNPQTCSNELFVWYDDCRRILAHIQLNEPQREKPDYHILYEKFLSVFDPQTRFDYGAFYTPSELARFAVHFTKGIVENEFNDIHLFENGNKIIDPCCGTGTFLEQLILNSDEEESAKIIGFEILPAPYALTHYRLSMLKKEKNYRHNVSIVLTNTLSDELEKEAIHQPENLLEEEQSIARTLSKPPLILIIGNPPSSDSFALHTTGENFSIIDEKIQDFRPPIELRTTRQNIQKQLQNDFIKFLRWSCEKLTYIEKGMFTLILPSSFMDHESYQYARKWLVNNYNSLWVLEIDLDTRTGIRSSNLFNTLQGRMLLIGLKDRQHKKNIQAQVYYYSITNLIKQQKIAFLSREWNYHELKNHFKPLVLNESYSFSPPSRPYDEGLYSRFWSLYPRLERPAADEKYVFLRHCSGVKLAPTSMFVHVNKQILLRRSREISDLRNNVESIKERWFSGQDRPPNNEKFAEQVRVKIGQAIINEKNIIPYSYRPFLNANVLLSEDVLGELSKVGGGGTRYRPEVLSAFRDTSTFGIAVAPSRKDIGEELHRFVSFCWALPDNDLCKRSNAHILCNKFPEYNKGDQWNPKPVDNINLFLLTRLKHSFGENLSINDILYYIYGVLCSNAFLNAFEGALFTVSGASTIPKVPITIDKAIFDSISKKGKELAQLEKTTIDIKLSDELKLYLPLFTRSFNLKKHDVDDIAESLELYEDGFDKPIISIEKVNNEILSYTISGYNILDQWLKLYSYRYSRTQFSQDNFVYLLKLIQRIKTQIELIKEIDVYINPIITGDAPLL
jgi:hypothetical protein